MLVWMVVVCLVMFGIPDESDVSDPSDSVKQHSQSPRGKLIQVEAGVS